MYKERGGYIIVVMNNNNQYAIPGAIVVAGVLIAGAVIFTNGGGSLGTGGGGDNVPQAGVAAVEAAEQVGVSESDLESCLAEGNASDRVNDDLAAFAQTGLSQGTPTSLLVKDGLDGAMVVVGARTVADLSTLVDQLMENDTSLQFNPQAGMGYTDEISVELAEDEHIRGNADAPIKLVEYSDFECPFCGRFHSEAEALIDQSNGQVAWVYRHLPLVSLHPNARELAEVSECVAEIAGNDAFWEYTDIVFSG